MGRQMVLSINQHSVEVKYATVDDPSSPVDWTPLNETVVEENNFPPPTQGTEYYGASLRICVSSELELLGSNSDSHKTLAYRISGRCIGGAFLLINKPEQKLVLYGESLQLGS